MCYWQGCKVTRGQYIRLLAIQKEVQNLRLNRPVQKGFDYKDWPIIKPIVGKKDSEIKEVHWEYLRNRIGIKNNYRLWHWWALHKLKFIPTTFRFAVR
jgi:hypothetical protein